jgi:hypothetical protein
MLEESERLSTGVGCCIPGQEGVDSVAGLRGRPTLRLPTLWGAALAATTPFLLRFWPSPIFLASSDLCAW